MFVMGGGVRGGRVLGTWPGLTSGSLEGPGDLPVTTNYRKVLAPILARLGAGAAMDKIFPGGVVDGLELDQPRARITSPRAGSSLRR